MSRWQERRDEIREEIRRYESDVTYELWRGGGNPDRINPDRMDDAYWNGTPSEDFASRELRRQRPPRESDDWETR